MSWQPPANSPFPSISHSTTASYPVSSLELQLEGRTITAPQKKSSIQVTQSPAQCTSYSAFDAVCCLLFLVTQPSINTVILVFANKRGHTAFQPCIRHKALGSIQPRAASSAAAAAAAHHHPTKLTRSGLIDSASMTSEAAPDEQNSSGWVSVEDSGANTPKLEQAQEIDFVTLGMFIIGMLFVLVWLPFDAMSLMSCTQAHIHTVTC